MNQDVSSTLYAPFCAVKGGHDPREPSDHARIELRRRDVDGLFRCAEVAPRPRAHCHRAQPPRVRQRRAQAQPDAASWCGRDERRRQRQIDAHGVAAGGGGRSEREGEPAVARGEVGGDERRLAGGEPVA
eukprot:CAMPEP_0119381920 /NCGR_PEP_ID=MMETSP1334-20130426/68262_1 /TAXON_ID=127549 /ORGANISM="Calcidiscus leptoporus, Strain RCC1130" /LENGTH=129 /DNA_ID=CAMNT_0007402201 /DNA_START=128 /DNA_END=514 /DNA_ORIENTATION=+